jgi:hypothetical protein
MCIPRRGMEMTVASPEMRRRDRDPAWRGPACRVVIVDPRMASRRRPERE